MVDPRIKIWNKNQATIRSLCAEWGMYPVLMETLASKGILEAYDMFRSFAKIKNNKGVNF